MNFAASDIVYLLLEYVTLYNIHTYKHTYTQTYIHTVTGSQTMVRQASTQICVCADIPMCVVAVTSVSINIKN